MLAKTLLWSRLFLGSALLFAAQSASVLADDSLSVKQIEGQETAKSDTATPHLTPLIQSDDADAQVTSVSQLSDVQPTDWAFQALQSLVERYGCIAGYPNGTFRGNRAATRYELAAALNACLDQVSDRFSTKEDLETVRSLQEEFKTELATLKGRVDGLEAQTATLEAQQFSTTTKLQGEAIFVASDVFGDRALNSTATGPGPNIDSRTTFSDRVRLNFLTSFTGKDTLYVRLQGSNTEVNFGGATGTNMTRLAFQTGNTGNVFGLDRLDYKFPVSKKLSIDIFANGGFHHYYVDTVNPFFEGGGGGRGALSWFGERNPIYRIGTVGFANGSTAGVGSTYLFSPKLRFDIGYLAARSNQSVPTTLPGGATDGGLFGGTYSALAQLTFSPSKAAKVALTYVRGYAPDGNMHYGTGSPLANTPFSGVGGNRPFNSNSFGLEASFRLLPKLTVGGWFGYTLADQINGSANADIINGAVNLAVPDLFKKGAVGGIIVGVPPKTISNSITANKDADTTVHLEALYQFPLNDNIKITPGVIYLLNPNHNNSNSNIVVGVIRTTFSF